MTHIVKKTQIVKEGQILTTWIVTKIYIWQNSNCDKYSWKNNLTTWLVDEMYWGRPFAILLCLVLFYTFGPAQYIYFIEQYLWAVSMVPGPICPESSATNVCSPTFHTMLVQLLFVPNCILRVFSKISWRGWAAIAGMAREEIVTVLSRGRNGRNGDENDASLR